MNIALIGKTGSGKSTLADSLSSNLSLEIISSNILRDYIKSQSAGWETVEQALSIGKHVPDDLLEKALTLRLSKSNNNDYIIDNLFSIGLLKAFEKHKPIDFIFYLEVPDTEIKKRVLSRARETNITEQIKNRETAFNTNFPPLKKALGKRLITLDGTTEPDKIYNQVIKLITGSYSQNFNTPIY